jgi:probable HAF family extracellular repeat protein
MSFPFSINDSGQVTICVDSAPEGEAFLYSTALNSVVSLTDKLGSTACATAINDSGDTTGGYRDNLGAHAFLFSDGKRRDIGPSGTDYSFGFAINRSGRVAGDYQKVIDSQGNSTERVFLYRKGKTVDIGDLGGDFTSIVGASSINKHGHIVGSSTPSPSSGLTHAFLYTPEKGMVDLNSLMPEHLKKIILSEARGINNRGQIIAVDTNSHSYLLTPEHEEKDEDDER